MIAENLKIVREELIRASLRAGRRPDEVRLLAVTKGVSAAGIVEAVQADQFLFGENYVQEACHKMEDVRRLLADEALFARLEWHFIGHLQRNKVKSVVNRFHCVQTVDSLNLACDLSRRCEEAGSRMDILLQVNIGEDPAKSGVLPQNAQQLLQDMAGLPGVAIKGLMTITPYSSDMEQIRLWYRRLRELRDGLHEVFNALNLSELSMGMSQDFTVAVEEGATIVRVGSAIFGERIKT